MPLLVLVIVPLPLITPVKMEVTPLGGAKLIVPAEAAMLPVKFEAPVSVSVPVPDLVMLPDAVPPIRPKMLPPSMGPVMVVLPEPVIVRLLKSVWNVPTVKVFPLATVQD